jgi:hypothetical protein
MTHTNPPTPAVGSGGNPAADEPRTEAGRRLVAEQRDPCAIYTLDPGAEDWESWALREVLAIEREAALPEPSLDVLRERVASLEREARRNAAAVDAASANFHTGREYAFREVLALLARLVPSDREAE